MSDKPHVNLYTRIDETKTIKSEKTLTFLIYGVIKEEAKWLMPLMNFLHDPDADNENITLNLHINSPGGRADISASIAMLLRTVNCKVNIFTEGLVASGATWICFARGISNVHINDHTTFLFHNATHYEYAKINDIKASTDYYEGYYKTLHNDLFKNVLTRTEINRLNNGAEIYLNGKTLTKRFKDKTE